MELYPYLRTTAITGGGPVFVEKPLLSYGAQLVISTPDIACYPSQDTPVNNAVLYNLVPGKPNGLIKLSTAGNLTWQDKGIRIVNGGFNDHIQLGAATDFVLPTMGNPDFLDIAWYKCLTSTQTAGGSVMGRGTTNTADQERNINLGPAGDNISIRIRNNSDVDFTYALTGDAITNYRALFGSTVQVAQAYESGFVKIFVNGVLAFTSPSVPAVKPYKVMSAPIPIRIGYGSGGSPFSGVWKGGRIYQLGNGKTASELVALDWYVSHVMMNS